ncbi:hypothetical protein ACTFIY_005324 [Dictyostelium cf. discoideum]
MNKLLSLVLFASLKKSDKPGDFDFYLFVQQWIYSYCESTNCIKNKIKEAFTIHGLGPENQDGSYPSFFNGTYSYFQAGVNLYQKFNLTQALENEYIFPSSKLISASSISNVQNQFGGKPGMQCQNSKISTIAMCITKDLAVMDCPDLNGWSCDGDVQLPSSY